LCYFDQRYSQGISAACTSKKQANTYIYVPGDIACGGINGPNLTAAYYASSASGACNDVTNSIYMVQSFQVTCLNTFSAGSVVSASFIMVFFLASLALLL